MSVQLSTDQLNRLFPFYIQFNKQLIITSCGNSVKKISPVKKGTPLKDCFKVLRPETEIRNSLSIETLKNQLVILECVNEHPIKLRGQFELLDTGEYLFMGSPWISGMNELKEMGLLLSDFSFHDPLIDLLHVIKTMEIANEDIKEIVSIYNEQQLALKQALKEKNEMAMFAMQSPFPFFRVDKEGAVLVENPASEQLKGTIEYGSTKLSFKNFVCRLVQDLIKDKQPSPLIIKAESRVYSLLSIYVEGAGYFNIYANEITEQQQLQNEVMNSANRLKTLITNLQAGVLLENETRKIAFANSQFCNFFEINVKPEQLIGADCSNAAEQSKHLFKNPDAFVQRINHILKEARVVNGDKLELTDGRFFSRDFIPIWNQEKYLGHLWVYNDITQEETAKNKIETQRIFYEEILNNLPADIAVFDPQHRYLFLNPRAVANPELRNWMIGKTDKDYMQLKNKPEILAKERNRFFKSVLESKQLKSFEEELITPSGSKEYHLRNFYPVLDAAKNVTQVIGYGLNITERKLIEDEWRKAKLETEQTAKAKEQFVAAMSHEIRTPLNGIIGITELLERTKLTAYQTKQLQLLKSSEEQLLRIVNEILEYERIINGHVHLEIIDFNIVQLVEEVIQTFQPEAKAKKLLLTANCAVPLHSVTGDPFRLKQVLSNLISNAIKFTPKGKIEVTVKAPTVTETKALFYFSVSDTGIGIQKSRLSHIYDPYFQESASISRKYGGTGLGLAISQNLLKLFNSHLNAVSKPKKGSQFSFQLELPLQTKAPLKKETVTAPPLKAIAKHHSLRVLVAEDVAINQYVIKKILNNAGMKCKIVSNGKEALAALRKQVFDLVLMDVEMPVMGGIEATRRIRNWKNKKLNRIPVIAITANAFKENRQEYLDAGMNDCIIKPFTQNQMVSVITSNSNLHPSFVKTSAKKVYSPKQYDLTYLKSLSTDHSFLQKTLESFCTNSKEMILQLQKALKSKKKQEILLLLHKLKSSAGVVGMQYTRKKIVETEAYLKKKRLSKETDTSIQLIISDFKDCINELKNKSDIL